MVDTNWFVCPRGQAGKNINGDSKTDAYLHMSFVYEFARAALTQSGDVLLSSGNVYFHIQRVYSNPRPLGAPYSHPSPYILAYDHPVNQLLQLMLLLFNLSHICLFSTLPIAD